MTNLFGDEEVPKNSRTPRQRSILVHERDGTLTPQAQRVKEWWNALCDRCPKLSRVTGFGRDSYRTRMLRARLNDDDFLPALETIAEKVWRNRFLRGDSAPSERHPNWMLCFEWLVTGDNWRKIAEGFYDASDDGGPRSGGSGGAGMANRLLSDDERRAIFGSGPAPDERSGRGCDSRGVQQA